MKKTLAFILALVLVMSLLPTTFAAEKNLAIYDYTRKYVFTHNAYGKTGSTTKTQDYWNTETDKSVSDQWNLVSRAGTNWMQLRDDANGANYQWNAYMYNANGGTVVAIQFDVDEAGTYTPKLTYNTMTDGYIHKIYILPDDGSIKWDANLTTNFTAVTGYLAGKDPVATIDMWGAEKITKTAQLDAFKVETPGKYLLVLLSDGYNANMVPYQPDDRTFIRAEINSFELVRDTGKEAVANGELEYKLGIDALNVSKMFVHGKTGTSLEGLRSTSLMHHFPYVDWEKTTTLGADKDKDGVGDTVEAYHTMNIEVTDPYRVDNVLSNGGLLGFVSAQVKAASNSTGVYGTARTGDYTSTKSRPQFVIRVNIPYAGKYTMTTRGLKYHQGTVNDVRFGRATTEGRLSVAGASNVPIIGKYYGNSPVDESVPLLSKSLTGEVMDKEYGQPINIEVPEAGEYWIIYDTSAASLEANPYQVDYSNDYQAMGVTGIKLTPISYDVRLGFDISASKTEILAGDSVSITASETMRDAGTRAVSATYKSSSPSVATVDSDGKVTAIAGGRTLITAETEDGATDSIWITVKDKEASKMLSYAITTSVEPNSIKVRSGARNEKITVTAEDIDGYKFRHWVRGSADNGSWISSDKSISFSLMTNTYLTAVYTEDKDEKIVEFFNENGEYYAEAAADADGKVKLPEDPTRTGFKFAKWLLSEDEEFTAETIVTKAITRAVARYEDSGAKYATTLPDGTSEGLSYGDKINRRKCSLLHKRRFVLRFTTKLKSHGRELGLVCKKQDGYARLLIKQQ